MDFVFTDFSLSVPFEIYRTKKTVEVRIVTENKNMTWKKIRLFQDLRQYKETWSWGSKITLTQFMETSLWLIGEPPQSFSCTYLLICLSKVFPSEFSISLKWMRMSLHGDLLNYHLRFYPKITGLLNSVFIEVNIGSQLPQKYWSNFIENLLKCTVGYSSFTNFSATVN